VVENSTDRYFVPKDSLPGDQSVFDESLVSWFELPTSPKSSRWYDAPGGAKTIESLSMAVIVLFVLVALLKAKNGRELLLTALGGGLFLFLFVLPSLLPLKVTEFGVSFLAFGRLKRVRFEELELGVRWGGGNSSVLAIGRTGKRLIRVFSVREVYAEYLIDYSIPMLVQQMAPFAELVPPQAFVQNTGSTPQAKTKTRWWKSPIAPTASEQEFGYLRVVLTGG
jgi:hypothetical protein